MKSQHYYSWIDSFSTDPLWSLKDAHTVRLDGQEIESVVRCMTGKFGFVELVMRDSEGRLLYDKNGWTTTVRLGAVEVEPNP